MYPLHDNKLYTQPHVKSTDSYLIYYNNYIDIKIACYLIRFYLNYNKKYKTILKSIYKKYYKLIKNDIIKIINNNNNDYIIFEYDKNNINYYILKEYSIDSDEFNNEIIENTKKLIIFINNHYLINNIK
jgi:hypothetical protein